jgi:hypothetical protein
MLKPLEVFVEILFVIGVVSFFVGASAFVFKTIWELITGEICE